MSGLLKCVSLSRPGKHDVSETLYVCKHVSLYIHELRVKVRESESSR